MMNDQNDQPKIHIDSDWKAEAEAIKERLAKEEAQQQAAAGPAGAMIQADFSQLIQMLALPAAMAVNGYQTGDGTKVPADLSMARYYIDLLAVLEDKTKGNLTDDEGKAIKTVLHHLRMEFAGSVTGGTTPPPSPQQPS